MSIVRFILIGLLLISNVSYAGNMKDYIALTHYVNKLAAIKEVKAQQAYEFGKTVLKSSNQSIAETIMLMNAYGEMKGHPVLCMPKSYALNGNMIDELIMKGFYRDKASNQNKLQKPVTTFVIIELASQFPCEKKL